MLSVAVAAWHKTWYVEKNSHEQPGTNHLEQEKPHAKN
jgi:hypothetical protein